MKYELLIKGKYCGEHTFPSLNEYIREIGRNPKGAGRYKNKYKDIVVIKVRQQLKRLQITVPVQIHYEFGECDRKRDYSNIQACAIKFIEDALQDANVIKNDTQKWVLPPTTSFKLLKKDELPYIKVIINEVETPSES